MDTFSLNTLMSYLPMVFSAAMIFIVGCIIGYISKKLSKRLVKGSHNKTFATFMANLTFTLILLITVIITLTKLGVPTATLVAVMGAASLAIGLALKNFLANIAAGFMIIFLKPFKIGDYVIMNSDAGTVTDINLFMTQLKTATNESLFVPNNKIMTGSITNQSYFDTRRMDIVVGVGYESDLKQVKTLLEKILENEPMVLKDPQSLVGVQDLANSAVNILVRVWVQRADILTAKLQLMETINDELTKAGINIPFPQMDVHLSKT